MKCRTCGHDDRLIVMWRRDDPPKAAYQAWQDAAQTVVDVARQTIKYGWSTEELERACTALEAAEAKVPLGR